VLSLTRGRICRLQLLVALASAIILGSKSHGTRDHTLFSQIRDLLFRRLLRLAGLRLRYPTPPPPGLSNLVWQTLLLQCFGEPCRSHLLEQYSNCVLSRYCVLNGSLLWISTFNQLKLYCICQNPSNRSFMAACVT
jgi:hypothetical protein